MPPSRGRNFTAAEDQPNGPRVAIITHDFWQRNLGGREDVIGRSINLDDAPYTVVGVMPKTFRHPYRAEIWLPIALTFAPEARNRYLYGVARMRPGITLAQADAAARQMCAAINQVEPDPNNAPAAYLIPLRDSFIMDLRPKLLIIAAAGLCALLVAAANFAGLMLARVVERDGEMALRSALGATRGQLIRQGLVQALILSAVGTICGLLIAGWLTPALVALSPEGADATGSAIREFDHGVRLDWPVFAFAAGAMLLIGIGFGLLPAWRASRTDIRGAMGSIGRGSTLDGSTRRLLGGLIVVEIAIAAVLLMGSLTLTQYFRKVVHEPWGFSTERRLCFQRNAVGPTLPFARSSRPHERSHAARAALASRSPFRLGHRAIPNGSRAQLDELHSRRHAAAGTARHLPRLHPRHHSRIFRDDRTTPGAGPRFAETDRVDSPPGCIVNESFARRFWPGQDPIGKRVKHGRLDNPRPWYTVVGVVADTKVVVDPRDGEVVGTICVPMPRWLAMGNDEMTFVVESAGEPKSLEGGVRNALARADSRLAAYNFVSLEKAAADSWVTERFLFVLVSLFGALGLVLASIGVYGLLALQVTRRTREFGVRVALGATAAALIRLVAKQGVRLLARGFIAGGIAAWAATRVAHHQFPDLPPPIRSSGSALPSSFPPVSRLPPGSPRAALPASTQSSLSAPNEHNISRRDGLLHVPFFPDRRVRHFEVGRAEARPSEPDDQKHNQ